MANHEKTLISVRLDADTLKYFKIQAELTRVPYTVLINAALAKFIKGQGKATK